MIKLQPILFSMTLLSLGGCITPYQTSFDCPLNKGVPCTSMSRVNKMIDKGLLGVPEDMDVTTGAFEHEVNLNDKGKKICITHFPKTSVHPNEGLDTISLAPLTTGSTSVTNISSSESYMHPEDHHHAEAV